MTRVSTECMMHLDDVAVRFTLYNTGEQHRTLRLNIIELPGGQFLFADRVTVGDWCAAAELAHRRLRRCSPGSDRYWSYRTIIAKAERVRPSLTVVGGAQ